MKRLDRTRANYLSKIVLLMAAFAILGFIVTTQIIKDSQAIQTAEIVCSGTCVALRSDKAEPDTVSIKIGEFVQFNGADGKSHSLSLGLGGEEHEHSGPYTSGEFQADEAWRVQFKKSGTFKFHDHLNPAINILVVVYKQGNIEKIES